ncbi:uncharacterized protein RSE6_14328 [Rhynchosporium secalis]|uniref:Uncharacterized protein n=1 Tax=Rhynchosporium secalis TaxID=38038 RepID=A0A1E1MV23_RHYSE|nr:uncharacterized protein RSE6_14328 [Rhynchosporium secalis]
MSFFLGARSNLLCPMLMDNPFPAPLLPRCDLLACAEDITDTWGPGPLVTVSDKSSSSKVYAIQIGGAHRGPGVVSPTLARSFGPDTKLFIGATAITIHVSCPVWNDATMEDVYEYLENIGAFLKRIERRRVAIWASRESIRQLSVQSDLGQTPGNTLKQKQPDLPENHLLPFLQSSWGIQRGLIICSRSRTQAISASGPFNLRRDGQGTHRLLVGEAYVQEFTDGEVVDTGLPDLDIDIDLYYYLPVKSLCTYGGSTLDA